MKVCRAKGNLEPQNQETEFSIETYLAEFPIFEHGEWYSDSIFLNKKYLRLGMSCSRAYNGSHRGRLT